MIDRRFVPGGVFSGTNLSDKETVVSCHNWTVMHDERYFSNPESFIPERWIESEHGNEICVKEAFIAFQQGRRNCVGKPYPLSPSYRLTLGWR
jgi:cytochrome P450